MQFIKKKADSLKPFIKYSLQVARFVGESKTRDLELHVPKMSSSESRDLEVLNLQPRSSNDHQRSNIDQTAVTSAPPNEERFGQSGVFFYLNIYFEHKNESFLCVQNKLENPII